MIVAFIECEIVIALMRDWMDRIGDVDGLVRLFLTRFETSGYEVEEITVHRYSNAFIISSKLHE